MVSRASMFGAALGGGISQGLQQQQQKQLQQQAQQDQFNQLLSRAGELSKLPAGQQKNIALQMAGAAPKGGGGSMIDRLIMAMLMGQNPQALQGQGGQQIQEIVVEDTDPNSPTFGEQGTLPENEFDPNKHKKVQ